MKNPYPGAQRIKTCDLDGLTHMGGQ